MYNILLTSLMRCGLSSAVMIGEDVVRGLLFHMLNIDDFRQGYCLITIKASFLQFCPLLSRMTRRGNRKSYIATEPSIVNPIENGLQIHPLSLPIHQVPGKCGYVLLYFARSETKDDPFSSVFTHLLMIFVH